MTRRTWSLYIVRCRDGSLYTGIATDVKRRLEDHRQAGGRGAKYLRGRGPLALVLERSVGSRSLALRLESRIKRLGKARKEELVRRPDLVNRLLNRRHRVGLVPATEADQARGARPSAAGLRRLIS